jgi:3-methyladenine DNA glycosylase AlkD
MQIANPLIQIITYFLLSILVSSCADSSESELNNSEVQLEDQENNEARQSALEEYHHLIDAYNENIDSLCQCLTREKNYYECDMKFPRKFSTTPQIDEHLSYEEIDMSFIHEGNRKIDSIVSALEL